MRLHRSKITTLLVVTCSLFSPRSAGTQERADAGPRVGPSFWRAASGVAAANGITWAYNWYVQRWPWANVGTRVWSANLRSGFVWDNDCFVDNQLAHPYHGSFYLNSARAAGYGFWASVPYVAVGSASWELFLENVRPSLNDFVNTTLGGAALGEVTFRLRSLLGPNREGRRNFAREVGAFALSPIAWTQGLLDGKARDRESPAESRPDDAALIAVGRRAEHAFVELAVVYGSPFDTQARRPYDAFEFRLELSPETSGIITHIGVTGLLGRQDLRRSARSQVTFGVFQHYDYDDAPAFKFSGQSVSAGLLFRRELGSRNQLNLGLHAEGIVLGGMSSDHGQMWRRDYDYGPGAGARLSGSFRRDERDLLRFDGRIVWLHSVHGSKANHLATFARVGAALPLGGFLRLGGDVGLITRYSSYRNLPSVTRRVPQVRAYLIWPPS
ncbi:MAG TPA: DUF3943 domain-containing protein [Chloroflexota bacterium]